MRYISTLNKNNNYSFTEALSAGLASDGGLFVPEKVPVLDSFFWKNIRKMSDNEIAFQILKPYLAPIRDEDLREIIENTFTFRFPLLKLNDNLSVLELFQGPTAAFKDVGARFLAQCASRLLTKGQKKIVLVATSGDTGGAVAAGFWKVPDTEVVILYPKSGISAYQEWQITHLKHNVRAVPVEGNFDDCQKLVKIIFSDKDFRSQLNLISANSINIGRLLPQMVYYATAYRDAGGYSPHFVVPSGNLGNLCAGVLLHQMGMPVNGFTAALNENDILLQFLTKGIISRNNFIATHASAMDIVFPSNLERLKFWMERKPDLRQLISAESCTDKQILEMMKFCKDKHDYLIDPHTAVGIKVSKGVLSNHIISLSTASPEKFEAVLKLAGLDNHLKKEVNVHPDSPGFVLENNTAALKRLLTRIESVNCIYP